MDAPEKKLEAHAEAQKAPEEETAIGLIRKIGGWVRDRITYNIPGFGWLRRKSKGHVAQHADDHGHAGHHDTHAEAPKNDAHGAGHADGHATPHEAKPAEAKEAHKKVDKLELKIAGESENEGNSVDLSEAQMEKLGVKEGDHVELFGKDDKSLGVFSVGNIAQEALDGAEGEAEKLKICTANVPEGVEKITVKKTEKKPEKTKNKKHKPKTDGAETAAATH